MVYAIKTISKSGKANESKGREKNAISLKVAERLLKHALKYVTPRTPIQAFKAFLACHIALNLKLRQITPKDDSVLLNTLYYSYHGKADNDAANGYKEADIQALIDDFIPSFATALALAKQEKQEKQDEDEREEETEETEEDNQEEETEEDDFYPSDFTDKQMAYVDAMLGGNRRKGLVIGMSLSKDELKACKEFLTEIEKELG